MDGDTNLPDKLEASQQDAEYVAWFREQVELGLREANDPKTVMVGNDEIFRDLGERLVRWRERAVQKKAS
ncbi:MAG TPA: hypothetical protein VII58_09125 [Acidobacteriaceae bacterium]